MRLMSFSFFFQIDGEVFLNRPGFDPQLSILHVLQRQDGLMQRSIREVNTSSRWCVLWDLDEDTHYSVQVRHTATHTHSVLPHV